MNNQTNINGNQNIVIQSATNSTISIRVNDEVREIRNDIDALMQLLQEFQKQQFQVGEKIYNIGSIGQAEFINIMQPLQIPQALTDPPFRHEHFIGREEELGDIYTRLRSDDRPLLLVNGQGGVGKTTLATHYFREHAHEYAHTAWVTCEGNIADDLISRLQDTLGIRDQLRNIIDRPQRTQILLRALGSLQKICLLVLDNANDPADLHTHYQVLRSCPNFHILLTTRINEFRQAPMYPIEGLPIADALRLFEQYYRPLSPTETQTVKQIHQAVGANTLVIELLAKNLHQLNRLRTQYTLDDLLHDLREKGLLQLQSKDVHTDYGSLQHAKPEDIIAAMYDMNPLDLPERRLLSIFSVLPPENIPFETLEMLLSEITDEYGHTLSGFDDIGDVALNLYQCGWVDFEKMGKFFKISPVVQEIIRQKQRDKLYEDCKALIRNLIEKLEYDGGVGHLINATYKEAAQYVRYSENVAEQFNTLIHNLSWLYDRIGNYYRATGDLNKTIFFVEKQAELNLKMSQSNPENISFKKSLAISYQRLGETYNSFGNLKKALEFYEKYNELEKELYTSYPDNVSFKNDLAISYQYLGDTHRLFGDLDKALRFFEQYNVLEGQLYESYPDNIIFKNGLAISYQCLGVIHSSLGNLKKALGFYEQYNELEKQLYAKKTDSVSFKNSLASSFQCLGKTHSLLGNLEKSLEFFEQFNELEKQLYESYPENVSFKNELCASYSMLGEIHSKLGNIDKSLYCNEKDLELTEELYESHPQNVQFKVSLGISYLNLGRFYLFKKGDKVKAKVYFKKSYDIYEELVRDFPAYAEFQTNYNSVSVMLKLLQG